jgi:hypothetical protein
MLLRNVAPQKRITRTDTIGVKDDSSKNIDHPVIDTNTGTGSGTNHSHVNKSLLDDLSVTPQNKLLVHGLPTAVHMHEETW